MKSRFKIFGGVGLTIVAAILDIIFLWLAINKIPNEPLLKKGLMVLFPCALLAFIGYQMFRNIIRITIRGDSIYFKNILAERSKYKFSELDGFTTEMLETRYGSSYEVLYLRKNNYSIKKVSASYISNYAEIKNELQKHLKHIGTEDSGL